MTKTAQNTQLLCPRETVLYPLQSGERQQIITNLLTNKCVGLVDLLTPHVRYSDYKFIVISMLLIRSLFARA